MSEVWVGRHAGVDFAEQHKIRLEATPRDDRRRRLAEFGTIGEFPRISGGQWRCCPFEADFRDPRAIVGHSVRIPGFDAE